MHSAHAMTWVHGTALAVTFTAVGIVLAGPTGSPAGPPPPPILPGILVDYSADFRSGTADTTLKLGGLLEFHREDFHRDADDGYHYVCLGAARRERLRSLRRGIHQLPTQIQGRVYPIEARSVEGQHLMVRWRGRSHDIGAGPGTPRLPRLPIEARRLIKRLTRMRMNLRPDARTTPDGYDGPWTAEALCRGRGA